VTIVSVLHPYPRGSYVPQAQPTLDGCPSADIDPVDYEIISHRLHSINDENGTTLMRTSGSPVVVFSRDFNSAIMSAKGEHIYFGRQVQTHVGGLDLAVRFLLESSVLLAESDRPSQGIHEGDMFVCNDPWIACGHANDIAVVAPVFHDGEIAFWTGNVLHHVDVGGSHPGSRDCTSRTVLEEASFVPPLKIVEAGVLRPDITAIIERQSRLSSYVALDLRAQVAGNTVAAQRLVDTMDEFGRQTVGDVVAQVLMRAEAAFCERLAQVPDGTWRERTFIDGKNSTDGSLLRVGMQLEKVGNRLIFSDDGSAPQQDGPVNGTFCGWRSGIICSIMTAMGADTPATPGGALRHIEFVPASGTILQSDFPAPVNRGTGLGVGVTAGLAMRLLNRALACSADGATSVQATPGIQPIFTVDMTGRHIGGSRFLRVFTDTIACGSGAMWGMDGDNTGGDSINFGATIPNVEEYEGFGGFLYLYRREERDTGGAGANRGGNTIGYAFTPYKAAECEIHVLGWGVAFPPFSGIFGGYPCASRYATITRDSDLWAQVEQGKWPSATDDLAGATSVLPGRAQRVNLQPGDVVAVIGGGGGGSGDPLERDPELVARDVSRGDISVNHALETFGVQIAEDGAVQGTETSVSRMAIRGARSAPLQSPRRANDAQHDTRPSSPLFGAGPHPYIRESHKAYRCGSCEAYLSDSGDWYLEGCAITDHPLHDLGDRFLDPRHFTEEPIVVRRYACPGCGLLFEVDVAPVSQLVPASAVQWVVPR
jgi:N-methylhydantoinase B